MNITLLSSLVNDRNDENETEISAKLTEASAEISAETLPKITWNFVKMGLHFQIFYFTVWY